MARDRHGQPAYEFFKHRTYIFNHLSVDLLNSRSLPCGGLNFGYSFKTHCYFIARCTLTAQVAGPPLSRVTWALFKLLVLFIDDEKTNQTVIVLDRFIMKLVLQAQLVKQFAEVARRNVDSWYDFRTFGKNSYSYEIGFWCHPRWFGQKLLLLLWIIIERRRSINAHLLLIELRSRSIGPAWPTSVPSRADVKFANNQVLSSPKGTPSLDE